MLDALLFLLSRAIRASKLKCPAPYLISWVSANLVGSPKTKKKKKTLLIFTVWVPEITHSILLSLIPSTAETCCTKQGCAAALSRGLSTNQTASFRRSGSCMADLIGREIVQQVSAAEGIV